jgi:hypothetical protein
LGVPGRVNVRSLGDEQKLIRKALIACTTGSAAGLFEAYEAVSYEILNSCVQDFGRGDRFVPVGAGRAESQPVGDCRLR